MKSDRDNSRVTRLLIVDDQELYREGMIGLMSLWDDFEVVGSASNGLEAINQARRLKPDMILMDMQMPQMDGVEAAMHIHTELPDIRIIMLTVSADEDTLFDAFRSGVSGYILKDTSSKQLHSILKAAVAGDMVLSEKMGKSMVRRMEAKKGSISYEGSLPAASKVAELTDRERELLRLVAQGLSNDEIGAQMYVSFGTVKKSLQTLMRKLQLPNRVMLAVYAVQAGLLDD